MFTLWWTSVSASIILLQFRRSLKLTLGDMTFYVGSSVCRPKLSFHLKIWILWSLAVLALYALLLLYVSSSPLSSADLTGETRRSLCLENIISKIEQSTLALTDGKFTSVDIELLNQKCKHITNITNSPELSIICRQGCLVCAACLKENEEIMENDAEEELIGSVSLCPGRNDSSIQGYDQENYASEDGYTFSNYKLFLHSLRETKRPNSTRSSKLLIVKYEDEEVLYLRLGSICNGMSNFSSFFELCHKVRIWNSSGTIKCTIDVLHLHTLIDEVISAVQEDHIAFHWTRPLLGLNKQTVRQVLRHIFQFLLYISPRRTLSGYTRESLQKKTGNAESLPYQFSTGVHNETILTRPRVRQLLQSPPPPDASPPPPSPPLWLIPPFSVPPFSPLYPPPPGSIDNSSEVDDNGAPVITGQSLVTIQNVSVYLTGVLVPGFSIQPSSANPLNTSVYEIVLQVDYGSMMIHLPSTLMSTVKHQVAAGNFWIGVPDVEWDLNPYAWVPGAGIQFSGTVEECNAALETLSYGKGLGNGRKSETVLTLICYPVVDGKLYTIAKAYKSCIMDIEGAGAWFTIFQYTKLFYTTSVGVMGLGLSFLIILCCILGCCVCYENKKERIFLKMQKLVKAEDAFYEETRVFNPFWIPSAAVKVGDDQFIITPNPRFHQQLQSEHLTRMHSIGRDGDLDAMQFLAAAQAAAVASIDANTTKTSEGERTEENPVSTPATRAISRLESPQSSQSTTPISQTSRFSTTTSRRFSIKDDYRTTKVKLEDPAADGFTNKDTSRTSIKSDLKSSNVKSTRFSIKDYSGLGATAADLEDSAVSGTDGSERRSGKKIRLSESNTLRSISGPKSDASKSN